MHQEMEMLLYRGEVDYLQQQDLDLLNDYVTSLTHRIEVYQFLREQEAVIFQPIANRLNDLFPEEDQKKVELALKYWISILRYCGMAMITNHPSYLSHCILDWVSPQIKAYEIQSLSNKVFALLRKSLSKKLSTEQFFLLKPFIQQIEQSLLVLEN